MSTTFQWATGAHAKVPAQIAGETLESIRERNNGSLTPSVVVEESRPKSAPLHSCFEWSDCIAGELYRQEQARSIIRSIRVLSEVDDEPKPVRAFVHVSDEESGPRYTSVALAMSDVDLRAQVLKRAIAELKSWRARYNELHELAQLFSSVDEVSASALQEQKVAYA